MYYSFYCVGELEGDGLVQKFGFEGLGDVFNCVYYFDLVVDVIIEIVCVVDIYDEMVVGVCVMDCIMCCDLFIILVWYLNIYWLVYYDVYEYFEELLCFGFGVVSVWWMN